VLCADALFWSDDHAGAAALAKSAAERLEVGSDGWYEAMIVFVAGEGQQGNNGPIRALIPQRSAAATAETETIDDGLVVRDANGTVFQDGDSVTIVKDLKVKGAASALKVGTRVKNIRLVDGDHNIDCKIDGFGPMQLKSEFVKKA
jgi:protein PhnA